QHGRALARGGGPCDRPRRDEPAVIVRLGYLQRPARAYFGACEVGRAFTSAIGALRPRSFRICSVHVASIASGRTFSILMLLMACRNAAARVRSSRAPGVKVWCIILRISPPPTVSGYGP